MLRATYEDLRPGALLSLRSWGTVEDLPTSDRIVFVAGYPRQLRSHASSALLTESVYVDCIEVADMTRNEGMMLCDYGIVPYAQEVEPHQSAFLLQPAPSTELRIDTEIAFALPATRRGALQRQKIAQFLSTLLDSNED